MIHNVRKWFAGMGTEHCLGALLLAGIIVWLLWKRERGDSDDSPPVKHGQEAVIRPAPKPDVILRPFGHPRIEFKSLRPEVIKAVNDFVRMNPRPVEPDK